MSACVIDDMVAAGCFGSSEVVGVHVVEVVNVAEMAVLKLLVSKAVVA